MTAEVSGLIFAKNEAAMIAQAVTSLQQVADEVVVADMASTDDTAAIARGLGARVIAVPDFGFVEPARSLGEEACAFDWILNLDADEVVPPELGRRLRAVASRDDVDAVRTSRLNYMIGSPVRVAGWGPQSERLVRFWRRGALTHSSRIHQASVLAEGARVEELPVTDGLSIWHFNYTGWDQFLEKLNRYTSIEAGERIAAGETDPSKAALLRSCVRTFFGRYVVQRGYRDGYRGLTLAALMTVYRLSVYAKVRQLAESGDGPQIVRHYQQLASDLREPVEAAER